MIKLYKLMTECIQNAAERGTAQIPLFSFTIQFMDYNFFINFFTSLGVFCWLLVSAYFFFFLFFFYFSLMEVLFFLISSFRFRKLIKIFIFRCLNFIFFLFIYEFFLFIFFFNFTFLNNFFYFLFITCCFVLFFLFKLIDFFLKLNGFSFRCVVARFFDFISKRINYVVIFYLLFQLYHFFKNHAVYERYCSSTSFFESLPIFFFTQLNTFFLIIFLVVYFLLKFTAGGAAISDFKASIFFLKCIFLCTFFGIFFNLLMLLFLNFFFVFNHDRLGKLSGIIMLFQNTIRINHENLLFLIMFSLTVLFFWTLVLFYYKKTSNKLFSWAILRLNVIVVFFQNIFFFESKQLQLLLVSIVICWNARFLVLFFFRFIEFLISYTAVSLSTTKLNVRGVRGCCRLSSLSALSLMDFFNWRGIIKPLNWVYVDSNKSILVAEQTTEVIVAAKLKSILTFAKAGASLTLFGGSHAVWVFLPLFAGGLNVGVLYDEGFVISLCDSTIKATCASFQDSAFYAVDNYFSSLINSLDQTPDDKVPLRKYHQLVIDRFDPSTDGEVIRRRDLAREGWVYFFFYYIAGDLLLRLLWRLIFGVDEGDNGDNGGIGVGQPPVNDTFVTW